MKKISIPASKLNVIVKLKPTSSVSSGNKWMKTSPNNAPAAKLTKNSNDFFNNLFENDSVKIPINEIKETINILSKICVNIIFF